MSQIVFIHCLVHNRATARGAMRIHWLNTPRLNATLCHVHPATQKINRIVLYETQNDKTRIVDASKLHLEDSFERIHKRQKTSQDNQEVQGTKAKPAVAKTKRFFELDVTITPNETHIYQRSFQLSVDIAYARFTVLSVRAGALYDVNGAFQTRLMLSEQRFQNLLEECQKLSERYPSLRFDYKRVQDIAQSSY